MPPYSDKFLKSEQLYFSSKSLLTCSLFNFFNRTKIKAQWMTWVSQSADLFLF